MNKYLTFILIILTGTLKGQSWLAQPSGSADYLVDGFAVSAGSVFVVGKSGTLLHTIDGGNNWNRLNPGTTEDITGIYFINNLTGFITGNNHLFKKTVDGGNTWTDVPIDFANYDVEVGPNPDINKIFFVDNNTGFIVVYDDEIPQGGVVFKTTNGANTWSALVNSPYNAGYVNAFRFPDLNNGFLVTTQGEFAYTTDGNEWNYRAAIMSGAYHLNDLNALDGQTLFVCGSNNNGSGPFIRKSVDRGISFTECLTDADDDITSVKMIKGGFGMAAGLNGTVLYTYNGGAVWKSEYIDNVQFTKIICFDETNIWLISSGGRIYKYKPSKIWVGGNGAWSDPARWSPAGLPEISDDVHIGAGAPFISSSGICRNIKVDTDGTLVVTADGILTVTGGIASPGLVDITAGNLELAGTSLQDIPAGTLNNEILNKFTINNVSGVKINSNITVNGELAFNNGILSTGEFSLIFANGARHVGASSGRFVDGTVIKKGNESFQFPVGNGNIYAPVSITAPGNASDQFSARYVGSSPNESFPLTQRELSLQKVSSNQYWIIKREAGASQVGVTLSWGPEKNEGITRPDELRVAGWNGALWKDMGNSGTTGSNTQGTVLSNPGIDVYNAFALGSTSVNNALPIKLMSFESKRTRKGNTLYWKLATPAAGDNVRLQYSTDRHSWNVLSEQVILNSSILDYSFNHSELPVADVIYYRLILTGEGKQTVSPVIIVNIPRTTAIYPNPVAGDILNVNVPRGGEKYSIYSAEGILVQRGMVGAGNQLVDLKKIPAGMYIISFSSGTKMSFIKL